MAGDEPIVKTNRTGAHSLPHRSPFDLWPGKSSVSIPITSRSPRSAGTSGVVIERFSSGVWMDTRNQRHSSTFDLCSRLLVELAAGRSEYVYSAARVPMMMIRGKTGSFIMIVKVHRVVGSLYCSRPSLLSRWGLSCSSARPRGLATSLLRQQNSVPYPLGTSCMLLLMMALSWHCSQALPWPTCKALSSPAQGIPRSYDGKGMVIRSSSQLDQHKTLLILRKGTSLSLSDGNSGIDSIPRLQNYTSGFGAAEHRHRHLF